MDSSSVAFLPKSSFFVAVSFALSICWSRSSISARMGFSSASSALISGVATNGVVFFTSSITS